MQRRRWVNFCLLLGALALWSGLQAAAGTATAQQTQTPTHGQPTAAPALPMLPAATLAELESWVQDAAPTIALSQAELALATQRERVASASQGARVFGNASLTNAREAVTDTLSRDYQRTQVQVGVRWPLLGSREAQLRALGATGIATAQAQLRLQQTQRDAVLAVRSAYVRHLRSSQRAALGQAFLKTLPLVRQQLQQRQKSGVLLEADLLDFLALFDAVAAAHERQQAQQQSARRELARLTDQPLTQIGLQAMVWPAACRRADALLAQAEDHFAVSLARLEMQGAAQVAEHVRREGVEAGVSLAQSLSRDLGGSPGRNTSIGVDFSVPLQWHALRDAALGQVRGEQHRAESLLRLRRSEFETSVEQALVQWQLRQGEMTGHLHRLQAAHEALRIALLRLEAFDGDGYSKLVMARHALYQAAVQVVDGAERRELAELDLQGLGNADCGSATVASDDAASSAIAPTVTLLADLPPVRDAAAKSAKPPAPGSTGLGWYFWDGQAMLDQPALLTTLPLGSQRIFLSFNAAQLRALATPAGQQQVHRLLNQAHSQGLGVALLLGEPTWVLPAQRQTLLDLLAPLRSLPWDGLHLDLERSQLPASQQRGWDSNAIDTLRAVRAAVPWPLALTTHHRELQAPDFAERVHAAGVTELVAMVYVSNPVRAAEIAAALLQGPPGLRMAVAQSVERSLSPEESSHGLGKAAALKRWRALAQALADQPHFSGIVVQSWEEFKQARP